MLAFVSLLIDIFDRSLLRLTSRYFLMQSLFLSFSLNICDVSDHSLLDDYVASGGLSPRCKVLHPFAYLSNAIINNSLLSRSQETLDSDEKALGEIIIRIHAPHSYVTATILFAVIFYFLELNFSHFVAVV